MKLLMKLLLPCGIYLFLGALSTLTGEYAREISPGHSHGPRIKRSFLHALGAVLKGAKMVQRSKNYSLFLKKGGVKQAKKDYRALNPTTVSKRKNRYIGKLGENGEVQLRIIDQMGQKRVDKVEVTIQSLETMPDGARRYIKRDIIYRDK